MILGAGMILAGIALFNPFGVLLGSAGLVVFGKGAAKGEKKMSKDIDEINVCRICGEASDDSVCDNCVILAELIDEWDSDDYGDIGGFPDF